MSKRIRSVIAVASAGLLLAATNGRALADEAKTDANTTAQPAPKKHSKAKGALVGGAGGAVVGGKKGAAVGAAGGALVQHHKNKKAQKQQEKQQQ
jgi:hypothetical protein